MIISFIRAVKFALQDIVRNFSLSLMTILILVLMLLSVNTLLILRILTTQATESVKNQIDVSIFFAHTASDMDIKEIRSFIDSFPEVVDITAYTREEVLEQFKKEYAGNEQIITSLSELGENPLGATLVVKTREPGDYQKIITALNVPEYEDIVVAKTFADTERAIQRIHTITTQVERFSIALTALFAVIAFLIIFNTVRVAIYTQRIEIAIKKLVGATNWFIRSPYIIESFVFTCFSVAITVLIVLFSIQMIDPYITVVFEADRILTTYFLSHILSLFGMQFASVLFLTIFSSLLAMRRHLRV